MQLFHKNRVYILQENIKMKKLHPLSFITITFVINCTTSFAQELSQPAYIRTEASGVKVYQNSGYQRNASHKSENTQNPVSTTPNVNNMMLEECRDYLTIITTKMNTAKKDSSEFKYYQEQMLLAEKRIQILISSKD